MPTENNDLPDSISDYLERMRYSEDSDQAEAASAIWASACGKKSITSMLNRQISVDDVITILGVAIESAGHNYYAMRAGESMVRKECKKLADAASDFAHALMACPVSFADEAGVTSEHLELLRNYGLLERWNASDLLNLCLLAERAATDDYQIKFPYFNVGTRKEYRLAAFVSEVDNEIFIRLNTSVRLSHSELAGLAWGAKAVKNWDDQSPISQSHDSKDPRAESVRKIRVNKR